MDIDPDIHLKYPGNLVYEFLEDNDKRIFRKYRLGENDLNMSISKCKRRYWILGGLDLIVLGGLAIYSRTLPEEPEIILYLKLAAFVLFAYFFSEYNKKIEKIKEMHQVKKDFEKARDEFINKD